SSDQPSGQSTQEHPAGFADLAQWIRRAGPFTKRANKPTSCANSDLAGDDLGEQTERAWNAMPELMQAIIVLATSLPTHLILLSVLSIFAAAILRGFTGFGFALAAVPLLSMFLSPKHAVPIAIMLQ